MIQKKQKNKIALLALVSACVLSANEHGTLFDKYGKTYDVPPQILWGIAKTESNFDPFAVNKNTNGTYDLGLMQINSIHLPWLKTQGIQARDLFDPEVSIAVGAHILSKCFQKHGQNWKGLTCYNGRIEGNNYASKVVLAIKREDKS